MNDIERHLSDFYAANRDTVRSKRPADVVKSTLLDIMANGTAIQVFREKLVDFRGESPTRIVVTVRRQRLNAGWSGVQRLFPVSQLETAIVYANKLAQNEISRQSLVAIA